MKDNGAVLLRRIIHERFYLPNDSWSKFKPRAAPLYEKLRLVPCIVDNRLIVEGAPDAVETAENIPFPEFWLEGKIFFPKFGELRWGVLTVADQERVCLSVVAAWSFSKHAPVLVGFLSCNADGEWAWEPGKDSEGIFAAMLSSAYKAYRNALMVINCKNFTFGEKAHDKFLQRKLRQVRGKSEAGFKYHIIELGMPTERVPRAAEGQSTETMPLHDVRSYVAEYGPEYGNGKLFGKYSCRLIIPAHKRGNAKNGIVVKDYTIPQSAFDPASPPACESDERALSATPSSDGQEETSL